MAGAFVELGAARGQVVRGGGQPRDRPAGAGAGDARVAAGRAAVPGGGHHRDALGGGLGPQVLVEHLLGRGHALLALAETGAQDRRQVVLDDVLGREVHPVGGGGGGGGHQADGGGPGHGPAPLHVQVGFPRLAAAQLPRVLAVDDDLQGPGREAVLAPEGRRVLLADAGARHDGDAHPAAVDPVPVERVQMVDGGEVPWDQVVPGRDPAGAGRPEPAVAGPARQVVQGDFLVVNVPYELSKLTLEV